MYEYVVWDNLDNVIHRGPWSEAECVKWIDECRAMFPSGAKIDEIWTVRRRAVGEWEAYNAG